MDHYYKPNERIDNLRIIKLLGEGRYGIVYLAEDPLSRKYVVKQLKKKMIKPSREDLFYEEIILNTLNSPQFPKFIGHYDDKKSEGYILEYKSGKVFADLIREEGWRFTRKDIYHTGIKILDIIFILQSYGIVHRDIRTPNVILNDNNELVLIDFGLARFIDYRYYVKQMDYWYLGDFLLHLYSTRYQIHVTRNQQWYNELPLNSSEQYFLKRLMGLAKPYDAIEEIHFDLQQLMLSL